jgi:SpoVK/Ycf46/Vps4 family AAA+-type ATPase
MVADRKSDEINPLVADLGHLARLASSGASDDVRLFVAKLVRKYRLSQPDLAATLDETLQRSRATSGRGNSVLRRGAIAEPARPPTPTPSPVDRDSQLSLIRVFDDVGGLPTPLLPDGVKSQIDAVLHERRNAGKLASRGLRATRSLAFVGPPGVGKTLTARWVGAQLGKPLWVLDLAAVMSSLLGRTGHNIRSVLDYAKEQHAVLLLDEFDAIAKRRGDDTDVGELKRVVTVMLQEIESWPDDSLLMAATNHPELVDPALWRRFDAVIRFPHPSHDSISLAISRFLADDADIFRKYVDAMARIFNGQSLSEVERAIGQMRRRLALTSLGPRELLKALVDERIPPLPKAERLELAVAWAKAEELSHNEINDITGVSRDTIRKHAGPSRRKGRGTDA